MLSGVPNFAFAIGYTNASWTLKVDLVCEYFCRLLAELDTRTGSRRLRHRSPTTRDGDAPLLDFQAGYVLRALDKFPQQGEEQPWLLPMSYYKDVKNLRRGPVDDGAMKFIPRTAVAQTELELLAA